MNMEVQTNEVMYITSDRYKFQRSMDTHDNSER
jgi:hypothetical protein